MNNQAISHEIQNLLNTDPSIAGIQQQINEIEEGRQPYDIVRYPALVQVRESLRKSENLIPADVPLTLGVPWTVPTLSTEEREEWITCIRNSGACLPKSGN